MVDPRLQDLEYLEAINQDEATRQIVLRMAGLARGGRLPGFIAAVDSDSELDDRDEGDGARARAERELSPGRRALPLATQPYTESH